MEFLHSSLVVFPSLWFLVGLPRGRVLLGHTRTVTDIYIHPDQELADSALARVIDYTIG